MNRSRLAATLAGAALLAGCGAAAQPPSGTPTVAAVGAQRVLVATLGDSITAGTPLYDPDAAVRATLGDVDERSQWQYWAARRVPGTAFRNCGIPGEQTFEIARRLDACVKGADVLVVQGGVNDIANGRSIAETAADLTKMVRAGKARGVPVLITELLPWTTGGPQAAVQIRALNVRIAGIARVAGIGLLRWHRAIADPDQPDRIRPGMTRDGAHPTPAGYRLLGAVFRLPR